MAGPFAADGSFPLGLQPNLLRSGDSGEGLGVSVHRAALHPFGELVEPARARNDRASVAHGSLLARA